MRYISLQYNDNVNINDAMQICQFVFPTHMNTYTYEALHAEICLILSNIIKRFWRKIRAEDE